MSGPTPPLYNPDATRSDLVAFYAAQTRNFLRPPPSMRCVVTAHADFSFHIKTVQQAAADDAAPFCDDPDPIPWLLQTKGETPESRAILDRHGITAALEKRSAGLFVMREYVERVGKECEGRSFTDSAEVVTDFERAAVVHSLARTPRSVLDGRITPYGSLPGAPPYAGEPLTLSWPSDSDTDHWCAWLLHCRREASADLAAFMADCKVKWRPVLVILRNVGVSRPPSSWRCECDAVVIELVTQTVWAVVELKKSPVGRAAEPLPRSALWKARAKVHTLGEVFVYADPCGLHGCVCA